ncbi:MAG: DUF3450 domain-containing protein [Pseudomonadota bacterium]
MRYRLTGMLAAAALFTATLCASAQQPEKIITPMDGSRQKPQETQKKSVDAQKQKEPLKVKYYELKEGMRGTAADIERMKDILAKQEQYITATNNKIIELENMRQNLVPYLKEVILRLEDNVNKDLPFLREERIKTLSELKYTVSDAKISMGEKLKKVLEALKTEMDYGYSVENSMGEIQYKGERLQVHLFRLGRVAMLMRTIDDKEAGIYNGREWAAVSKEYGAEIKKAMDNARRSKSAEFVNLPLKGVTQ